MAILSVTPENPLLWAFLMENFNLGIAKMSVIPENPLFPNPVLPKTSVPSFFPFFAGDGIREAMTVCILKWRLNHFVIVGLFSPPRGPFYNSTIGSTHICVHDARECVWLFLALSLSLSQSEFPTCFPCPWAEQTRKVLKVRNSCPYKVSNTHTKEKADGCLLSTKASV